MSCVFLLAALLAFELGLFLFGGRADTVQFINITRVGFLALPFPFTFGICQLGRGLVRATSCVKSHPEVQGVAPGKAPYEDAKLVTEH